MSRKKMLRQRRYIVKKKSDLALTLQSTSGEIFSAQIVNVSLRGILITISSREIEKFDIKIDQILPSGKLNWLGHEFSFGRSVIKFIKEKDKEVDSIQSVGLFLFDAQIPVEGNLSQFLELDLEDESEANSLELGPSDLNFGDFLNKDWNEHDIFAKAKKHDIFFEAFKKTDRWAYYLSRKPSKGTRVRLSVPRQNGRDDFIVMSSNDYLGLSSRPEVITAAKRALDQYGFGSTGSAITVGQTEEHDALEEKISRLFKKEAALLFNSGYAANLGIITSLVGPNDLVVADFLSHASIYDAMQMVPGTKRFFKHNDVSHLRKILERSRADAAGALIIAEGVFSVDGDAADLKSLKALAREFRCRLMIDEAHSFGVLGPSGLGLSEEAGLLGAIDITMGTFSKICGGIGGFATASREVINWLRVSARSAFFSVSLPPSTVAAANAALDVFLSEPQLLGKLRHNIEHFVTGLREIGFKIPADHRSAVIPAIIGDESKMASMHQILYDAGVYAIPVIYPGVSRNNCRFRFTMNANHTVSDLDYTLLVLRRALETVGHKFEKHSALDAEPDNESFSEAAS